MEPLDKLISVEKAKEIRSNWKENQAVAIERGLGRKDVSDFLFDLEELQEYLNLVREKSREQGIENPGLRIFFAAYPAKEEKRSTIFLAPTQDITKEGEVGTNYDISPLNTITGGWPPMEY